MKKNTRDNEYAYRPLTNRPIVRTRTLSSQRLSRMPRPHKRFGHASYRRMEQDDKEIYNGHSINQHNYTQVYIDNERNGN